jgi:DNA-binding MurR/RpiR family transcriptional regulator
MLNHFKVLNIKHPIWLSATEAAKLAGVSDKTIRRALKTEGLLKFRIVKERYQIELGSVIMYMHRNKKLRNKILEFGIGQYYKA